MFTGIIETVGTVSTIERKADLASLVVDAPDILEGVKLGDSIAVNGCCLTVTSLRDAADTALAQAKIAASEQAELTRINLVRDIVWNE